MKASFCLLQNSLFFLSYFWSLFLSFDCSFVVLFSIPEFLLSCRSGFWLCPHPRIHQEGTLWLPQIQPNCSQMQEENSPLPLYPHPLISSLTGFSSSFPPHAPSVSPSILGFVVEDYPVADESHALSSENIVLWMPRTTRECTNYFWCSFEIDRYQANNKSFTRLLQINNFRNKIKQTKAKNKQTKTIFAVMISIFAQVSLGFWLSRHSHCRCLELSSVPPGLCALLDPTFCACAVLVWNQPGAPYTDVSRSGQVKAERRERSCCRRPTRNFVGSVSSVYAPAPLTYPEETDLSLGPVLPLISCVNLEKSINFA